MLYYSSKATIYFDCSVELHVWLYIIIGNISANFQIIIINNPGMCWGAPGTISPFI